MTSHRAGQEFVGIGVGAIVFNEKGEVFIAERGPLAKNDQGKWGMPGGEVEFGETLEAAIRREVHEEFGMDILVVCQLAAFDHLLSNGGGQEHWVSVAFVALHLAGDPRIREPGKCVRCGWYGLGALPGPLTALSVEHFHAFHSKFPHAEPGPGR